jgi:hypothetical protein
MVALRYPAVKEQAVQHWRLENFDIALLYEFTSQGLGHCLAGFYSAARQLPAGDIGMRDKKDPLVFVNHEPANAECHPPGPAPIEVKSPADRWLKCLPHSIHSSRGTLRKVSGIY